MRRATKDMERINGLIARKGIRPMTDRIAHEVLVRTDFAETHYLISIPLLDRVSSYGEECCLDLLHHITLSLIGVVNKRLSNDQLVSVRSDESMLYKWTAHSSTATQFP